MLPEPSSLRTRKPAAKVIWQWLALLTILFIAAFGDFFRLSQNGYGNLYYAAAVKSMLVSWHNFFFVSFDPGGFVTVDKPPLGLWIQAASAKLFGFHGLSLFLPQALAGIAAVAVLYHLVKRVFGVPAGLLAALALALTPISIATNRDNNVDGLLVLVVLLGAWAVSKAAETGQLRCLLLSGLLLGLGFNIKMLEAYLVLPAFLQVYLLGTPHSWRLRVGHLAMAGGVMLVVSLSWALAVDFTPASHRPYVGSSSTNSEIELAFGYNGLERLIGFAGVGRRAGQTAGVFSFFERSTGFLTFETGAPGPLRLLNQQLGAQASWLLPLAVIGLFVVGWRLRPRTLAGSRKVWLHLHANQQQQALILWGMWLLTQGVFFSIAGFFHAYYLVMLVPAICALAGIGVVQFWSAYQRPGWLGWVLPVSMLISTSAQIHLLASAPNWNTWLTPLLLALSSVVTFMLFLARLGAQQNLPASLQGIGNGWSSAYHTWMLLSGRRMVLSSMIVILGLFVFLLAPTAWSLASLGQSGGFLPLASPTPQTSLLARFLPTARVDLRLVQYLETHRGQTRYLLAIPNAMEAAPIILATGQPVMAMGGFAGTDPILTPDELAHQVQRGEVRFFLLPSNSFGRLTPAQLKSLPPQLRKLLEEIKDFPGGPAGRVFNTNLISWLAKHCSPVPPVQWSSSGNTGKLLACESTGSARGGQ